MRACVSVRACVSLRFSCLQCTAELQYILMVLHEEGRLTALTQYTFMSVIRLSMKSHHTKSLKRAFFQLPRVNDQTLGFLYNFLQTTFTSAFFPMRENFARKIKRVKSTFLRFAYPAWLHGQLNVVGLRTPPQLSPRRKHFFNAGRISPQWEREKKPWINNREMLFLYIARSWTKNRLLAISSRTFFFLRRSTL